MSKLKLFIWYALQLYQFLLILIIYLLFSVLSNPHGGGSHGSTTNNTSYDSCGANFCVSTINSNDNLERPDDKEIYEISAIYLACIVAAAILIAILVDPLSR